MRDDMKDILADEKKIQETCDRLAAQINQDYPDHDRELVFVIVLKGSVLFATDLIRRIDRPCTMDFMKVSSYGSGVETSGFIQVSLDLKRDLKDTDVIIVEDIVDSGNTIVELKKIMEERGAAESYICSLLLKPEAYKKDIKIDYVAMEIPNDFIVGFGLDYDELGRNYKDIYILDK